MQVHHVRLFSIRRFVLWCIILLQPVAQIGQQALGTGRGILHVYTYLQMVHTYCRTFSSPTTGTRLACACCACSFPFAAPAPFPRAAVVFVWVEEGEGRGGGGGRSV